MLRAVETTRASSPLRGSRRGVHANISCISSRKLIFSDELVGSDSEAPCNKSWEGPRGSKEIVDRITPLNQQSYVHLVFAW